MTLEILQTCYQLDVIYLLIDTKIVFRHVYERRFFESLSYFVLIFLFFTKIGLRKPGFWIFAKFFFIPLSLIGKKKLEKILNCEKNFFTKSGRKFPRVLEILSQWWLCSFPVPTTQVSTIGRGVEGHDFFMSSYCISPHLSNPVIVQRLHCKKGFRFSRLQDVINQTLPGRKFLTY